MCQHWAHNRKSPHLPLQSAPCCAVHPGLCCCLRGSKHPRWPQGYKVLQTSESPLGPRMLSAPTHVAKDLKDRLLLPGTWASPEGVSPTGPPSPRRQPSQDSPSWCSAQGSSCASRRGGPRPRRCSALTPWGRWRQHVPQAKGGRCHRTDTPGARRALSQRMGGSDHPAAQAHPRGHMREAWLASGLPPTHTFPPNRQHFL